MAKPDVKTYRDRMDKAVAALKEEFSGLRTGRANAGLLEPCGSRPMARPRR